MSAELSMAAERRVSVWQHNQREESSGILDFCKEDDKELGCMSPTHSSSWGAWAWPEERQDKGVLQCKH